MVLGLQEETKSEATLAFTGGPYILQVLVIRNESYRVRESAVDHRNESTAAHYSTESIAKENRVITKELTHACTNQWDMSKYESRDEESGGVGRSAGIGRSVQNDASRHNC
jgi:hypothetical protein